MKRNLLQLIFVLALFNISCGGAGPNGLSINVIPTQPYAIPFGTTTVNGLSVTAPYFILNNVNLTWAGPGNLEIVAIIITTPTNLSNPGSGTGTGTTTSGTTTSGTPAAITINCGVAGDTLTTSYPSNVLNGNVVIGATQTATSTQIACGGFTLPNPLPTFISVSAQVQVVGIILDANNNATGRIITTQSITVQ